MARERLGNVHHIQSVLVENGFQFRIAQDLPFVLRILQILFIIIVFSTHVLFNVFPNLLLVLILTQSRNSHGSSAAHVRAHEIRKGFVHWVLLGVTGAFLRFAFCHHFLLPRRSLLYFYRGRFGRLRKMLLYSLLFLTPNPNRHDNVGKGDCVRLEHLLHGFIVDNGLFVVRVL